MCAESKKDIVKSAYNFTQEGKWDKAIQEYKKLLTLDPTDYNVHNMLGDIYMKKKDDSNAYQEYLIAAEAYIKQGLADKAAVIYKKIAKLDSDKLNETDRKKQIVIKTHSEAEKFLEEKQIDKAIDTYLKLLKVNPDDFESYQKLGDLYTKVGNKTEAINYYKRIVDVYFKNRIFKKALPIFQKMIELQPDDISLHERIAEIFEKENNESDAKREYLFLAEYFWKQKNIEKTDFYSQKAIDFKSIEAHYFKGVAMFERKEYGEAKKELEMLLKFKANHVGAILVMGEIYKSSGQIDDAISTFNKVIKIEEDNTHAHEMIAELQMQKGLKKEAVAKYIMVANIYIKKHEQAKAEEVLNNVLKHDPENIEVLQKLGDLYASQDIKKNDAANVYIKIAEIYKKENIPDKETEYYKLAEEMNPAHQKLIDKSKKMGGSAPITQSTPPAAFPAAEKPPAKEIIIEPIIQSFRRTETSPEPELLKQEPVNKFEPVMQEDFFKSPAISKEEQLKKIEEIPETVFDTVTPVKASAEDVPALIAMADSYVAGGSFDEAIEMYQQAASLDPGNQDIKNKLNFVYSKYAGLPPVDINAKKKSEEDNKKKEAEEYKKKTEEEKKKKEDEERRKKEEEQKKKADEEKKKKEADEHRKKEEEQKKKVEEEKKKKEDEERKKKEADKAKTMKADKTEEIIDNDDIGNDFITVTTAEIFMKQGLLSEAEKILNKIVNKDMNNLEARMKLEELKKIKDQDDKSAETEEKKPDKDDDQGKKGKQSKVSYI